MAEDLLYQYDPIRTVGIDTTMTYDPVRDFYTYRNYRMNYFAVKAMQARVHLWNGNFPAAKAAAEEVVLNDPMVTRGTLFPWVTHDDIIVFQNPDRIFSTEVIFGIRNRDMYSNYDRFFSPTLLPANELAPRVERLEQVFETEGIGSLDYRFNGTWQNAGGEKDWRVFYKYRQPNETNPAQITSARRLSRTNFFQPIIRKSELYYILAECEHRLGNSRRAWDYLHTVRWHRNIETSSNPTESFPGPAEIPEHILKEYTKEFYGEGQLFYYYKRMNIFEIPNALTIVGSAQMSHRFPLPDAEIINRRR
jgi:hypothetical protein